MLGTIQHFVMSEPELYREDTHTHRGMHTHMYTSQTVCNDRNWEIMSTYRAHVLDSKFHFLLKIVGISWKKLLTQWIKQGKYKMSLECLAVKASDCSKNDEEMSKGQRGRLKEIPTVQGRNNINIKIYNDRDRL